MVPTVTPSLQPTPSPIAPDISPGDWSSYLLNNGSFNDVDSNITPATASQLKLYWTYHAKGAISTQPVEVNGIIYWGSWDGYEQATALDGQSVWSTYLGRTSDHDPDCDPSEVGVASTAAVTPVSINGKTTLVVFVGGGDANFYALDAENGHVIWKTSLGTSPAHFIWASPTVFRGSVYIGLASFGDCPGIQGELVQMSVSTGAIQHIFKVVPDGCLGGGVWGSPTVDSDTGDLYIATGNADTCGTTEAYAVAVVELRALDLSIEDSWQVPQSDQFEDSDFGDTPTLFKATIGGVTRSLVGAINKNGIYYAFLRGALSNGPVWIAEISYVSSACGSCEGPGTFAPSAWDGTRLYVGGGQTTIKGNSCGGSVRALDPATGHAIWEGCLSVWRVLAPVTVVPGVVVVAQGEQIFAVNATTGDILFSFKDTSNSSAFDGGPTIAHGMLYIGNLDGNLYAFGLDRFDQRPIG